jgi:hypothetical protein
MVKVPASWWALLATPDEEIVPVAAEDGTAGREMPTVVGMLVKPGLFAGETDGGATAAVGGGVEANAGGIVGAAGGAWYMSEPVGAEGENTDIEGGGEGAASRDTDESSAG